MFLHGLDKLVKFMGVILLLLWCMLVFSIKTIGACIAA